MKIIEKAIKKLYRFNCPICGTKLEAEGREFTDLGNKVSEFYCPVCRKSRYINWSSLRNHVVYEGKESDD